MYNPDWYYTQGPDYPEEEDTYYAELNWKYEQEQQMLEEEDDK